MIVRCWQQGADSGVLGGGGGGGSGDGDGGDK